MNRKKIRLFLAITFSISWLSALIMYLTGMRYGSIASVIILALIYMPSPAFATLIVQKIIYKEPLSVYGLTLKHAVINYFLLSIVFYLLLILLTAGSIYLLGNSFQVNGFGELSFLNEDILNNISKISGGKADLSKLELPPPVLLFFLGLIGGVVAGSTLNLPFTLGEELGWRGLLLKETQMLGFWKSNVLIGAIWGAWHMPIILMGHNFPKYPVQGVFMMIAFCISLSFMFSILRLRAKSVFAPAAFHGMINAGGSLTILFVTNANELIGSIAGLAGIIAATVITSVYLLIDKNFISDYRLL